jgi:hypothetical protein
MNLDFLKLLLIVAVDTMLTHMSLGKINGQGDVFFAMPLLYSDICREKRDQSNFPPIDRSLFTFMPFFGSCNPPLLKGA